jgi:hypothetical protein
MTGSDAWKVMAMRFKNSKRFVQERDELACRDAPPATTAHRRRAEASMQGYMRTHPAPICDVSPPETHRRVTKSSSANCAASKLLPMPSPRNAKEPSLMFLARRKLSLSLSRTRAF